MDVKMPEMGGFEPTAVIRRGEKSTATPLPIIAMTAHAMKGDRERCLEAGMDDYVTKPLDSRRLCAAVESAAAGHPSTPPAAEQATPDTYSTVLARVGGDAQLLTEISRLFIDDVPGHLEKIRAALDGRDGEALRRPP